MAAWHVLDRCVVVARRVAWNILESNAVGESDDWTDQYPMKSVTHLTHPA